MTTTVRVTTPWLRGQTPPVTVRIKRQNKLADGTWVDVPSNGDELNKDKLTDEFTTSIWADSRLVIEEEKYVAPEAPKES
jgi:hypothetical protein